MPLKEQDKQKRSPESKVKQKRPHSRALARAHARSFAWRAARRCCCRTGPGSPTAGDVLHLQEQEERAEAETALKARNAGDDWVDRIGEVFVDRIL